jgi:hypothetical protein
MTRTHTLENLQLYMFTELILNQEQTSPKWRRAAYCCKSAVRPLDGLLYLLPDSNRRQLVSYQKEYFGDDAMGRKKAFHFLPGDENVSHLRLLLCLTQTVWAIMPLL